MYYYIRPLAFARAMQFVHLLKNFNSWVFFVVKLGNFFSRKTGRKIPHFDIENIKTSSRQSTLQIFISGFYSVECSNETLQNLIHTFEYKSQASWLKEKKINIFFPSQISNLCLTRAFIALKIHWFISPDINQ